MIALPFVIGHRGARASAPENTLAGLRAAQTQGARWVEVDAQLSADGVPVLLHDDTLDRTTNGHGRPDSLTLAELKRLDAGSWFSSAFAGEPLPTLVETLDACARLGLGLNLELKIAEDAPSGAGLALGRTVLAVARDWWRAGGRLSAPPLISSFDPACLEAAQEITPGWPRGCLFERLEPGWTATATRVGATTVHFDHRIITPQLVSECRAGGWPVLAYTVNDGERAGTLAKWGVAAVFCDCPGALIAHVSDL
ncbi:Glycerophosphodiester phosphodiesterase, cytoplasmic [uncultured Gammaproteobacteria bacterium]